MAFYLYLQLGRTPSTARWETGLDGPDVNLTEYKTPCLAELMLFDATSLVSVPREAAYGGPYPDLISDRESAVIRFQRRLPHAQAALRSDLPARRSLEAFGQFMAAIDWPYVRLATGEHRLSFAAEDEEKIFNEELAFAVSALDLPAVAGPGQRSPEWERLLNFCLFHDVCGMPFYFSNEWAYLLCGYLPRRGAPNFSQIERARRLLDLSPEQEEPWRAFEAALRPWVVYPADWKIPEKLEAGDVAQMEASLSYHSKPLMATLSDRQKRLAHRLFGAIGLKYRGTEI